MVIKVKGAGQAIPLPATAGQIAEIQTDLNIVTPTAAQILISANSNLGALAPSVQTLINDAVANAIKRANHTGNDPATNVVFAADGLSLEAWRIQVTTALANAGSSAPVNTAQPVAATGTTTVNSVLTAATGTWTGASTYLYQWYQQNATTGVRTPIVGAVSSTYTQLAADIGFKIIYTVAGVSAAGVTATPVFAAGPTAAATTGTAPTNSGTVPTITGSAPSGSAIGYDVGVWTGATTWGIQLYDNNVAVGSRVTVSATTGSLTTSTTGQVGHVLKIDVIGYSSLNVPSASAITSSNTITVTGVTPPVVNTAVPVWGATLQLEVQNDFTPGTWTGTINVARTWDFYKVASPNDILVRAGNTVDLYTPHASEGVAVGDNLYIIETVTETATGNTTTARSVNKAIASTPVALAATTNNTGLVWTQNSAITAVIPVTATGGTTPYTYTCSG